MNESKIGKSKSFKNALFIKSAVNNIQAEIRWNPNNASVFYSAHEIHCILYSSLGSDFRRACPISSLNKQNISCQL